MRYSPSKIEKKWQKKWLKLKVYEPNLKSAKNPFYNLMMFPYPSAEGLHVGNMYAFVGSDIYGRFKRMQGHDVFEPIGLDGFGIHSENYALKIGKHPMKQAKISQKNFYRQLGIIGNGFAWEEKLETYDPNYYKWTQWIFIQLFKKGLAYRKKAAVNWCPSCMTVLADEQVIQKAQNTEHKLQTKHKTQNTKHKQKITIGVCERCETPVIKKDLEQWFFKITDYVERLLKNLGVIDWSEKVKIAQRNWIGKSEGALIKFPISLASRDLAQPDNFQFPIEIFTTRPDTLFGTTYMVLAPEHPLVGNYKLQITNYKEVEEYLKKAKAKTEEERIAEGREKTGVELKGVRAVNPATKGEIPIFVADYVLGHVGTGAIMGVPAHDQRDFEFARKFSLSIEQVVAPYFEDEVSKLKNDANTVKRKSVNCILHNPHTGKYATLDWGAFGWHTFIIGGVEESESFLEAAKREIREETGYINFRLVRSLGRIYSGYYAAHKGENRLADTEGFLFELIDEKRDSVKEHEKQIHRMQWRSADEVSSFVNLSSQTYLWKQLQSADGAFVGNGVVVNSDKFDGMPSEKAKGEITKFVDGQKKIQYRLRDWLISRQRYWGPPIPVIFCGNCKKLLENPKSQIPNPKFSKGELENPGWIAVPEKDLPVKLPFIKNFRPTGTDKSPLADSEKFYKVRCPKCKSWARRETDVSDTFLDSAWYFLRYPSTHSARSGQAPWDQKITRLWLPVNMYIGGAEHSVLHLFYSRFLTMVFRDLGLLDFEEPFTKFRGHGLLIKDGAKMSKSKGNVVIPDGYIKAYGADALRMYLMFLGPFEQGGDFRDTGIRGITRFLERVWKLVNYKLQIINYKQNTKFKLQITNTDRILHKTIKKVTEDIEGLQYNTAISALMILLNEFERNTNAVSAEHVAFFLKLLAPFAPHISEELHHQLFANPKSQIPNPKQISNSKSQKTKQQFRSIYNEPWPEYDPKLIQEDTFELVVQINGRVRGRVTLPRDAGETEAKEKALLLEGVKRHLPGKSRKIIFVPQKLINFVL